MPLTSQHISVALLDLYDGYPNTEIRNFIDHVDAFNRAHPQRLSLQIFDVRGKAEVPGLDFDIYLSSGGPGSPLDTEGTEWENRYWALIDAIDASNKLNSLPKKHVLFVCHSFQLMCRRMGIGVVNQRDVESFGIYPVVKTQSGKNEPLFEGLPNTFYAMDMREWQVVDFDHAVDLKVDLLSVEAERPDDTLPRALMAIRYNPYFFGTQFHPEVDPDLMKQQMLNDEHKQKIIDEYGLQICNQMINELDDQNKLALTHQTIIPKFLLNAVQSIEMID